LHQLIDQHNSTAYFESADGLMILVLDPHFGTGPFAQQWPAELWCCRQHSSDNVSSGSNFIQCWQHFGA